MSGDDSNAPKRDAQGRFIKGSSGNQRGRRPKKRRLDVPTQLARDFLELGRQVVTVSGPNGPRQATRHELVVEAVFAAAVKGRASAQKLWMEQMKKGWEELMARHPSIEYAELMRQLHEDPMEDHGPEFLEAVDEWIRRMKRL